MTHKHTAGPWYVHTRQLQTLPKSFLKRATVDVESNHLPGEYILLADCGPYEFAENMANAHLIAAAPDLLTALYETLAALETHLAESARDHNLGNVSVLCPCSTNEVVRAKAAIAKAEGRQ